MKMNKSFHIYGLFQQIMYRKGAILLIAIFLLQTAQAQQDVTPDFMRSVGKIYVVAAVTLVILLALFAYMIILDRKISRFEKRHKNE